MVTYYVFRLAGWLVPRLPLAFQYWSADRLGWLAYHLSSARRRNLTANLRHVLGPQAEPSRIRQVAIDICRLWIRNQVDFFLVPTLDPAEVDRSITLHGWEHVEASLERGKGLILSSLHFGTPDTTIQVFGTRGLRPVVMAERLEPRRLYEYVSSVRASHGLIFVPVGDNSSLKTIIRTLRSNGVIGLAADRDVTGSGRVVTFFGAPARLPDGHVTLALRTGAALLMAICLRHPDNTYEITIQAPIKIEKTGDTEADIEAGMRQVVSVMESAIGANPEQWVYFHPVWLDSLAERDNS